MSAQPANTTISVFRSVRGRRADHRHDSVESLTKKLRPLHLIVPGEEITSGVQTRDTAFADFSPYMGEASPVASRGMPVVVGLNATVDFAYAEENLPGVGMSFQIGRDKFITNDSSSLSRDLHRDARAL